MARKRRNPGKNAAISGHFGGIVKMKYELAVLDIESTGLNRFKDMATWIGVGLIERLGDPVSKYLIYNMSIPADVEKFKRTARRLKERKLRLIWQNGKWDTLFIQYRYKIMLPIHYDVMLMGTAYDLAAKHGLKDMAMNYLGVDNWDIDKKTKTALNDPKTKKYLKFDVKYTGELFNYFLERMTEKQWLVYEHLLRPAFLMYRRAEKRGIYFNREGLRTLRKEYKKQEALKLAVMKKYADINWNSPAQVSNYLFESTAGPGLPTIKRSEKTGNASSEAKVLKRLKKDYKIAEHLMEYKYYYGANTKFLNQWDKYAQYDNRIHPTFGLTNVVTGRTSCKDPNLQQVPRRKELRTLYTAAPGRVLIEADYSQIELRVAADYANDPVMIRIYNTGGDIHTETAMSLTGLNAQQVKGEPRSKAKAVNFGFLYGMSARGFIDYAYDSYDVVFTKQEAERYRELFFVKYPRLLTWHKEMEIICENQGGVANRFGQFRKLPDIYNDDRYLRSKAVRRAINTPVQGTASSLLLVSAVEIDEKLRKDMDLWIVGTVHDSILADVPEDCVKDAIKEMNKVMVNPTALGIFDISFKVPLEADFNTGPWGDK